MDRLGAVQLNTVWSWCGVNDAEKRVYFSVWTDKACTYNGEKAYVLQEPHWGIRDDTGNQSAARNDQDAKFALVFEQGYQSFGYFIVAKDPNAVPREIEETRTSFVMRLEVHKQPNGVIVGIPRERIEVR